MTSSARLQVRRPLFYTGVIWSRSPRSEMKLINHSRFYWLAACVLLTRLMARIEARARTHTCPPVREACPQISMSDGPLSSARYWLAALGSLRVSTSQAGVEDERGCGGRREINLARKDAGWEPWRIKEMEKEIRMNISVRTARRRRRGRGGRMTAGEGWRRRSGSGDAVPLARPPGRRIDFRHGGWLKMSDGAAHSLSLCPSALVSLLTLHVVFCSFFVHTTRGARGSILHTKPQPPFTCPHTPSFKSLCLFNEAFRRTGPVILQYWCCCCFPLRAPPLPSNALLVGWQLMVLELDEVNVAKALKNQLLIGPQCFFY